MNIIIGNYQTKNFDICPLANEAFSSLAARKFGEELQKVEQAAKYVDAALAVNKKVLKSNSLTNNLLDIFDKHASKAEEILDDLGELEEHYYIRDFVEANMMDFYEIDWEEIEELDSEDDIFDEDDFDDDDFDDDEELEFDETDFGERY